ncbi:MAG: hypothetical protein J5949_05150, partial [Oscillospiraceae bacterium]|nr:hypothetical protein [Oscillospiraceae bacterium]
HLFLFPVHIITLNPLFVFAARQLNNRLFVSAGVYLFQLRNASESGISFYPGEILFLSGCFHSPFRFSFIIPSCGTVRKPLGGYFAGGLAAAPSAWYSIG